MKTEALNRHDFAITVSVFVVKCRPKSCGLLVRIICCGCIEKVRFKSCHDPRVIRHGDSENEDCCVLFRVVACHAGFSGRTNCDLCGRRLAGRIDRALNFSAALDSGDYAETIRFSRRTMRVYRRTTRLSPRFRTHRLYHSKPVCRSCVSVFVNVQSAEALRIRHRASFNHPGS